MRDRWLRLFQVARANHGVATVAMARGVGLSGDALRRRATAEGWVRLARGVWLTPGAADTHRARAAAHLALLGERSAVSHFSAAHLHGLRPSPPSAVELLVPAGRRPDGREGARVTRSRTLVTGDVTEVDGLRTTAVARTLRDLAPRRTWEQLYDLATEAEQRGLVTLDELVATMQRLHRGPGAGRFRDVVRQRLGDRSDSALERDARDLARGAGFAPSAGPFPTRTPAGSLLYLDVAFPDVWFALECDGFGFHRDRAAFERDRERWRMAQMAGWRLTWVTRRRLRDDPQGILAEIAEAHRRFDGARAPALPAA